MKINSAERIEEIILEKLCFGDKKENLDERSARYLDAFPTAYTMETFSSLNENQLMLLFVILQKDSENSDHLSFSMGWSRRATINTANALVRKGLCYWDLPTSSNADGGNDLTIARDKLANPEILKLR
ncbi:MAG: hypothetical protein GY833_12115 [Aestuariibacter sp.]|nr:hypothetical protein [Aestuariibacter sp.]|tara:strand:+ start:14698 stop:15081 length:384 start_codon:yes stop_codon:yes gene_type:complete